MAVTHITPVPKELPFHAEGFGWEAFERFCGAWLVAGASLPNLAMNGTTEVSRLGVLDAQRMGTGGEKQHGIDLLLKMGNRATWVIQCKRVEVFDKSDFKAAITKAKQEFGSYQPAHYLIWVTGRVTTGATLEAHSEPDCTLWSAERMTTEFLVHTSPGMCRRVIELCFGPSTVKQFFPIGDQLLLTESEFFARWEGEERSFHHRAALAGRNKELEQLVDFASGGKACKALIVSAAGGVGKTRLLREVARRTEAIHPGRLVRFINPQTIREADLPTFDEIATTTIIHDDAHRMDLPAQVLALMHRKEVSGLRLILSTRPGAEASLRELLMRSGMEASDVISFPELKKLTLPEMVALASSILEDGDDKLARAVASMSDGCALITLVGSELLRQGRLKNLDLVQSDDFRSQVLDHFAQRELDQAAAILPKPTLQRLLNAIALLSPWPSHEAASMEKMMLFLDLSRQEIEAAIDELRQAGLFAHTHKGLRISPDLFSDHLAYRACYDEDGRSTAFLRQFLAAFIPDESSRVMQNLAEAEWRASQKHRDHAEGIFGAVWRPFLEAFEGVSFWDRGQMVEKWAGFAFFQPDRALELARWAIDLKAATPGKPGYESMDSHSQVLQRLPPLLKPIAIWHDKQRLAALEMLWEVSKLRLASGDTSYRDPYADLAEVASFKSNFPAAPAGVLDWLEAKLSETEATSIADKPCGLLQMVLRPYFASSVQETFMSDRRTFVFRTVPLSVSKTDTLRKRALKIIRDTIVPRGSVAIINVIPLLVESSRNSLTMGELPPEHARTWEPERLKILELVAEVSMRSSSPLVHFLVRRRVQPYIVHGKHEASRVICRAMIDSMPESLEFRLARLTLSSHDEDSFAPWDENNTSAWHERIEAEWKELQSKTVSALIAKESTTAGLRQHLESWSAHCEAHGFIPRFGDVWSELYRQKPLLAIQLLSSVINVSETALASDAQQLFYATGSNLSPELEELVLLGLSSKSVDIVCGFIHAIRFTSWLQTPQNITALVDLTKRQELRVLRSLLGIIEYPSDKSWADDLCLRLLENQLDRHFLIEVSVTLSRRLRHGKDKPSSLLIQRLLEQMTPIHSLPANYEGRTGLDTLASHHPRLVFNFFLERVHLQESREQFEAIPYGDELLLNGLEKEPGFEAIGSDLLDTMLSRPTSHRHPWQRLFTMAFGQQGALIERLLLKRLPDIQSSEDISDLCGLIGFQGSRLAYTQPDLIEALLDKASIFGPKAYDELHWDLIHASRPTSRGYTNGVLDAEYDYALPAAEEALKTHTNRPKLRAFYQKIIEIERADAERQQRIADSSFSDDWAE
jgi:hypothetical protein